MTTRRTNPAPALNRSEVWMLVAFTLSMAFTVGAGAFALTTSPNNPVVWGLVGVSVALFVVTVRLMVKNMFPRGRRR